MFYTHAMKDVELKFGEPKAPTCESIETIHQVEDPFRRVAIRAADKKCAS